jgi:hypothetical protein
MEAGCRRRGSSERVGRGERGGERGEEEEV